MLEELQINGYALIDSISFNVNSGLTILTGETGAGKSILAGALGLLLGLKGDTGAIRTGKEETLVSASLKVENNEELLSWLNQREIEPEEGIILIRRTLKKAGRGSIYIQSTPVTLSELREFSALVFDMHSQHEHQSLLSPDNHRRMLDRYGGTEEEARHFGEVFTVLSTKRKELQSLLGNERDRLRELDILQFSVNEIEEARLNPGEEEELEKERTILNQYEKLYSLMENTYSRTAESRGGALANVREAMESLNSAAEIDENLVDFSKRMNEAFYELEDISGSVRDYQGGVQFSADRLESCEQRLAKIHRLEKKYGGSVREVLDYKDQSEKKIAAMENYESEKKALEEEIQSLEKEVFARAKVLSEKRAEAAKTLEKEIESILKNLGMPKAEFHVEVQKRMGAQGKPSCAVHGIDNVEFTISPNQGEPAKPLKDIASGGEISRIMLAIKSILAENDSISCLIFDEIDSGIGGEVGVAIGEYLHGLAAHKQVLCITHLASIAARADTHLRVEKIVEGGRTNTSVSTLNNEERVEEIARMLAGDREGKASLSHARELLSRYRER
jgi:DNA repair protein RecN (Recombination protein N)